MIAPDFTFEAVLSYSKTKYTHKEVREVLEFIKNYTLEINEVDLTKLKYGGIILN